MNTNKNTPYPLLKWTLLAMAGLFLLAGCGKKEYLDIYEVNTVESRPVSTEKDGIKSDEQYISILYANLFQEALSPSELLEITDLIRSIGDKETAYEMIISNWMNSSDIIIPSDADMRNDLNGFIEETYMRFYVRQPTQAEKEFFLNFIDSDPNITPELVYMSFALSDEYMYY